MITKKKKSSVMKMYIFSGIYIENPTKIKYTPIIGFVLTTFQSVKNFHYKSRGRKMTAQVEF